MGSSAESLLGGRAKAASLAVVDPIDAAPVAGPQPRLAMVAGEASGDLLAGLLLQGLRRRWPGLRAEGIGGPRMAEQGFEAWWPHHKLAVRGYFEVLRHLRELLRIRRQLGDRLLADPPTAFVGIDAPDFNFGLEARLKAAGVRTIHFVSPSIWAWRPERIHKIKQAVDLMLCVFPFEPALYERVGMKAVYVGHPLADTIPLEPPRATARAALGLQADDAVIALLPGSRLSEAEHMAPRFVQAATLMHAQRPGLRFVLPIAPGLRPVVERAVRAHAADVPMQLLDGRSHEVLAACDVTLIASGTATLEAALFKRPMVISYHMNRLTYGLMKRKQLQPWVGLPNILCEDFVVPELLQDDATPQALARETLAWLSDAPRAQAAQRRFHELHERLRCDTARRATDAIAQVLAA